jgi:hypothetical protein
MSATTQSEPFEREETIHDLDVPEGQAEGVRGGLKADSNEVAVENAKGALITEVSFPKAHVIESVGQKY